MPCNTSVRRTWSNALDWSEWASTIPGFAVASVSAQAILSAAAAENASCPSLKKNEFSPVLDSLASARLPRRRSVCGIPSVRSRTPSFFLITICRTGAIIR